jgi:hypothetical protein
VCTRKYYPNKLLNHLHCTYRAAIVFKNILENQRITDERKSKDSEFRMPGRYFF